MTSEQKRLVEIFNVLSILFFVVAIVVMTAVVGGVNRRVFWNSVHEVGKAGSIPFRSFQRPEVYIPMVNSYGLPTVCATFKAPAGTDFPAVYIPGTSGGEKDEVCAYRKRRDSNIKLARSQYEDKFKKLAGVTSTSSEPGKQGEEELWERLRRKVRMRFHMCFIYNEQHGFCLNARPPAVSFLVDPLFCYTFH